MDRDPALAAGDFFLRVRSLDRSDPKITKGSGMKDQTRLAWESLQCLSQRIIRRETLHLHARGRHSSTTPLTSKANHIVAAFLERGTEDPANLASGEIRKATHAINGLECRSACDNGQRTRFESWQVLQNSVSGGSDACP